MRLSAIASTKAPSTYDGSGEIRMHAFGKSYVRGLGASFSLTLLVGLVLSLLVAGPAQAELDISAFSAYLANGTGTPLTEVQAGSHPDLVTDFSIGYETGEHGGSVPNEQLKDVDVDLPAGFYGNPSAVSQCSLADFFENNCSGDSQVGVMGIKLLPTYALPIAIYNLPPEGRDVATFGVNIAGNPVRLGTVLRPDGGYALRTSIRNTNQALALFGSRVTLWGVPADPVHDPQRSLYANVNNPSSLPPRPLLTAPARCDGPNALSMRFNSWQDSSWVSRSADLGELVGCDKLQLNHRLAVRPVLTTADTPSGYDVDLSVEQQDSPTLPSSPTLRRAVLALPQGVVVSPASADGLQACSDAEIAPKSNEEPTCPAASKIGTVRIDTPVLEDPLEGEVFVGTPMPGEMFRLWLVARGSNVLLKLPGTAQPDPATGQLRVVFDRTPELPFTDLHVHLKGGSHAVLVNPDACGTKTTTSELETWGGPTAAGSSSFDITGCSNSFSPNMEAGAQNPLAGASSPFQLRITRNDREQKLGSIDLTLPPGQLAKLRGVPYCPDATLAGISGEEGSAAAEAASPSCPPASQVGSTLVGAGAGTTPLYVGGKAYLAGPYKGAPLSIAFVTPALAGPFDLGNVVVRSALKVDPVTAKVEAVSDPLPTILHGVPLDLKDVRVSLDRPDFTVNPTSCKEMQVVGQVTSSAGTAAPVSNRFQLADCAALGFAPKLSMSFSGPTHRSAHPALRAVLKAREGDANIAKAVVTLPKTEFLENAHIRTVCTRVQYAADSCPKGSVYGYAKAWSPLLDKPLQGSVYLRSSNHTLPDLVASLDGQIHIDLDGRIDSVGGRIRTTFAAVPDAPVSRFVLNMQGGKKGLLVNNTELCRAKPRASAKFTGHNGKRSSADPLVKVGCGKK